MQLTSMAEVYPNTKNVHMKTAIDFDSYAQPRSDNVQPTMRYLHTLEAGPCDMKSGYGIMMAGRCGFPEKTIHIARGYQRILRDQYPLLIGNNCIDDANTHVRSLFQQLSVLRNSHIDLTGMRNFLQSIRGSITPIAKLSEWLTSHYNRIRENKKSNPSTLPLSQISDDSTNEESKKSSQGSNQQIGAVIVSTGDKRTAPTCNVLSAIVSPHRQQYDNFSNVDRANSIQLNYDRAGGYQLDETKTEHSDTHRLSFSPNLEELARSILSTSDAPVQRKRKSVD